MKRIITLDEFIESLARLTAAGTEWVLISLWSNPGAIRVLADRYSCPGVEVQGVSWCAIMKAADHTGWYDRFLRDRMLVACGLEAGQ